MNFLKKSTKILNLLCIFLIAIALFPNTLNAQETKPTPEESQQQTLEEFENNLQNSNNADFSTNISTTYQIAESGITTVSQDISVINNESEVVATEYSQIISGIGVENVEVLDPNGNGYTVNLVTKNQDTIVTVTFERPVVGQDQSNDFTLVYETKDIASQVGELWNLRIPRAETLGYFDEYEVTLKVPNQFGAEIFVSPNPKTFEEIAGFKTYTFEKNNLRNEGINASFGKFQALNFDIDYVLRNEGFFSSIQQIAIPLDILEKQQIVIKSLEPKPLKTEIDKDGNILASYNVEANSEINIKLTGSAKISSKQIRPQFGGSFNEIPKELKVYTEEQPFWEVDSPEIQALANELFNENLTVAQNAQNIYDYITQNLEYDFSVIERDFVDRAGAVGALNKTDGWACMEYTDLFIAIARAMGIPARELNGFAFSGTASENSTNVQNKETAPTDQTQQNPLSINLSGGDLLHAWPEFYDPEFGWVQIDPTWGSTSEIDYFTKLDTNHFAFVRKGISSEFPLPAGAYKFNAETKQVNVEFAQNPEEIEFTEKLTIFRAKNYNLIQRLRKLDKYILQNSGGTIIYNINDAGINLAPFETTTIYLPNTTIKYKDFNGESKFIDLVPQKGKPEISAQNVTQNQLRTLGLFVGGVLVLCTIFYGLVNLLGGQKK